jgi:hypothetical protein
LFARGGSEAEATALGLGNDNHTGMA